MSEAITPTPEEQAVTLLQTAQAGITDAISLIQGITPTPPSANALDLIAQKLGFSTTRAFDSNFLAMANEGQSAIPSSLWNPSIESRASQGAPWPPAVGGNDLETDYPANAVLAASLGLVISATGSGKSWKSAVLSSYGHYQLPTSGKSLFQFQAELPDCRYGMWPGLWFLPGKGAVYPQGQNGDSWEMDLIEGGFLQGNQDVNTVFACHYEMNQQQPFTAPSPYPTVADMSKALHVYSVIYEPGVSATYFFDGVQQWVKNSVGTMPYEALISLQVAATSTASWHTIVGASNAATNHLIIPDVASYEDAA